MFCTVTMYTLKKPNGKYDLKTSFSPRKGSKRRAKEQAERQLRAYWKSQGCEIVEMETFIFEGSMEEVAEFVGGLMYKESGKLPEIDVHYIKSE